MGTLELARWQFGVTTVYHFLFVPLTIGLSFLVAGMQTAWVRTGHERWYRLTRFYGKLFLINFAMGVATGIVQEFQFGMNWSDYSRFVGDVFGAPLAIEGLLAFFLESTFLGLWIFGWGRLPKRIHLACIWLAAVGTALSAYFILAANSFMQHPVGYRINPATHRAELTDFWAVMTNSTNLVTFPHTIAASFLTGGGLLAAIAFWHLRRRRDDDTDPAAADGRRVAFRSAARVGTVTVLIAAIALAVTGDIQGKIMTEQQPMKMASAEALYHTEQPAAFSIVTIGSLDGKHEVYAIKVPRLLSFLATGSFDGKVEGIDNIQAEYQKLYGPGSYTPIIPVTYWSFRLMIGLGLLAAAVALVTLWALRRGRTPRSRILYLLIIALPLLPLAANSFGWIFTEMGRQPWLVFSQLRTGDGVSPGVSGGEVLTSLIAFTALYGALAVVEVGLMLRGIRGGLGDERPPEADDTDNGVAFAY
ncbi:cytochrome ubiquinol oxidase subunit I [Actinocatenispora thailandica]|uniref:Cytochrome ubiquinol oxidase subunit I n=1 Tax=Actinocatenispora thailandica TaxID=227318 RepID=A0A7R7HWS6_9ACTN|nr:cytochrome ubiquinol oxidase subunit I [Actinocatenispora thailandica]BCJ35392.1 cytochrome ubiquinol oxidase subunit I [Actinocatenispora thailandica]